MPITNAEFKSILEYDPVPGNPVMSARHFEIVDHMLLHYVFVPSCFSCKIEKALSCLWLPVCKKRGHGVDSFCECV
jgi:hypothetical protein